MNLYWGKKYLYGVSNQEEASSFNSIASSIVFIKDGIGTIPKFV